MAHPHDHQGHSHTPVVTTDNERKLLVAFAITFTFMVVEAIGGVVSGSLALLADAGHMLTDASALALAYAAFRFGRRAADDRRTFGYLRFEVIAGLINALTLFAIVGWIGFEAVQRFRDPQQVLAGPMLVVAAIGLLVNILVLRMLTRGDTEHVNIQGAALHVLGDLLGSAGAIVAAVVIHYTGWMPIDPILSVIVALLILRSAWSLLLKSLHILLEGTPDGVSPEQIECHLGETVKHLAAVRHIHVWQITSGRTLATLHVMPQTSSVARQVVDDVKQELNQRFNITHSTVAIDWPDDSAEMCNLAVSSPRPDHKHEHGQEAHGNAQHDRTR